MPDTRLDAPLPPTPYVPPEPAPDAGSEIGAAIDAFAEGGVRAVARVAVGPILGSDTVVDLVGDGVASLLESERETAARHAVTSELRAGVHGFALERVDQLRGQVAATRAAYLGPGGRARRDALRSRIDEAQALKHQIWMMRAQLPAKVATRGVMGNVSDYVIEKVGLGASPGSLQAGLQAIEAKERELAQLLRESPALGALELFTFDAGASDEQLQAALQDGFVEADNALAAVATDIRAGNLSFAELAPMVKATMRTKGWTRARADAGDLRSRMAFEALERAQHVEAAVSGGITVAGAALTAAALLTTGPLGAAALVAAGVVNVGGAAYELSEASEVYGAATAGLSESSGIADKAAAEDRLVFAALDGAMAFAEIGPATKALRGVAFGRSGGAAARPIRPTDPTDVFPIFDDGRAAARPIRPTDPTDIVHVSKASSKGRDDLVYEAGRRRAEAPTLESLPARDTPTLEVRRSTSGRGRARADARPEPARAEARAEVGGAPEAVARSEARRPANRPAVEDGIDADAPIRGDVLVRSDDDFFEVFQPDELPGPVGPRRNIFEGVMRQDGPVKLELRMPKDTAEARIWNARARGPA